jgi:hypothetical protein
MSDLSLILITVRRFFTGIALGEVHLHLSLIPVRKANITEGNYISYMTYHPLHQSIRAPDGVTTMSLSANLI